MKMELLGHGTYMLNRKLTALTPREAQAAMSNGSLESQIGWGQARVVEMIIRLSMGHGMWAGVAVHRVMSEATTMGMGINQREWVRQGIKKLLKSGLVEIPGFKHWALRWLNSRILCPTPRLLAVIIAHQ